MFLPRHPRTAAQAWGGDREVSARRGPARGGRVEGDAGALAVPATNDRPGDGGTAEVTAGTAKVTAGTAKVTATGAVAPALACPRRGSRCGLSPG
jgi:hypothetical protein